MICKRLTFKKVSELISSLIVCRGFVDPCALHCLLILIGDFVLEGILKVLPGLSLFTLVFICIFPAWLIGACDFCLSCSGLMGDKFF